MIKKITAGADIEFVVINNTINGQLVKKVVSAEGLLGANKKNPTTSVCGNFHEDNVMAEIAINIANSKNSFKRNINSMKMVLSSVLAMHNCSTCNLSSSFYRTSELITPQALEFSCDPDMNAYTKTQQIMNPDNVGNLRTAGGHVHIGIVFNDHRAMTMAEKLQIVKLLDVYLGVPSVLLDPNKIRRRLYGQAGSFRSKPYGLEYRVLSNFWALRDDYINWVYEQMLTAVNWWDSVCFGPKKIESPYKILKEWLPEQDMVIECINGYNATTAKKIISDYGIAMP